MPALRPVPGVVRVTFKGTSTGQPVINVFHFKLGAPSINNAGMATFLQNVRSPYEVNFIPRLQGAYSGDTVYGVDLSSEDGAEGSVPLGGTPGAATTQVPQSTACCVTWKIPRHYRGGHPRTYIGPTGATSIESPTSFTSAYVTALQNAANTCLTSWNAVTHGGGNVRLVCVHRYRDKVELATPLVSEISSAVVDTRIDTMRRRLGRDR